MCRFCPNKNSAVTFKGLGLCDSCRKVALSLNNNDGSFPNSNDKIWEQALSEPTKEFKIEDMFLKPKNK